MKYGLRILIIAAGVTGVSTLLNFSPARETIMMLLNKIVVKNHTEYDEIIHRYASLYAVDCSLVKAIMYQENPAWDPREVSPKGAVGLMQVMPRTAKKTQEQLFDPQTNIQTGVHYLSELMGSACPNKTSSSCQNGKLGAPDCTLPHSLMKVASVSGRVDDSIRFVLAAYNGGPCGANTESARCAGKARWECENELLETHEYVPKVIEYYQLIQKNKWGCEANKNSTL